MFFLIYIYIYIYIYLIDDSPKNISTKILQLKTLSNTLKIQTSALEIQ